MNAQWMVAVGHLHKQDNGAHIHPVQIVTSVGLHINVYLLGSPTQTQRDSSHCMFKHKFIITISPLCTFVLALKAYCYN
jgi:hypothetical protein